MTDQRTHLLALMREIRSRIPPAVLERCRAAILGEAPPEPTYPGHQAVAIFLRGKDEAFRQRVLERARTFDPAQDTRPAEAPRATDRDGGAYPLDRIRARPESRS